MCDRCIEDAHHEWERLHAGDQKAAFGPEARPTMELSTAFAPPPPDVHVHVTVPPSDTPDVPPIQLFPTITIPGLLEFVQGHLLLEKRVEILEARLGELNI